MLPLAAAMAAYAGGGILGIADLAAALRQVAQERRSNGDGLVRQVGSLV
jgi:hypothetical protein